MRHECLKLFPQLTGKPLSQNIYFKDVLASRQTGVSVNPKNFPNFDGEAPLLSTIFLPECVSIHGVGKQVVSGNLLPQLDGEDALS